jgi:hypothetical protein
MKKKHRPNCVSFYILHGQVRMQFGKSSKRYRISNLNVTSQK